jgi:hypothetical protein
VASPGRSSNRSRPSWGAAGRASGPRYCPSSSNSITPSSSGATVLALFPLAIHGGPLWQPLCYAQIGGLSLATFIELPLVKACYAICVEDLKIVKWQAKGEEAKA